VCELRERRLNEEDSLGDLTKSLEQTRKERESQNKKLKVIETALKAIERDIVEFQREKQAELNKITLKVTLAMHQIRYLSSPDNKLPLDLGDALVFSGEALERLRARIGELIEEKAELRVQQKQLHRDHVSLNKEMKSKEERIKDLEARAREIQLLKFGQLVDLEVVDRLGMDKGQAELKVRLKAQEQRFSQELEEMDRRIRDKFEEFAASTEENTELLRGISSCLNDQKTMERNLDQAQTGLFVDVIAMKKKDAEERDRLVLQVNAQAEEINRMKAEILRLRTKTGKLYG
jgi:cilia- and flagella-associated protein 44